MSYDLTRLPAIAATLEPMQKECLITLALKITDDTCKMDDYERSVFMKLYDTFEIIESAFFAPEVFALITEGRTNPSAQVFGKIGPLRKAGMDYIGQPNMKAFKAAVRAKLEA
jgi:hypothetical protein